ncbi:hypothetical protein GCM10010123_01470 [Pilimelia anulata]|uniref:M23ase beta-sheet core domain-containing protein n=1 Tax=Pilimelia anulata TaxID=53371 RepID=A0A8J3B648_9ACTN|nr:M23 family metallopeptidase [Pilimelia anulata]GGJ75198.1 hypothetical protein GCM10010123_01470 [Pilimelia anulata]
MNVRLAALVAAASPIFLILGAAMTAAASGALDLDPGSTACLPAGGATQPGGAGPSPVNLTAIQRGNARIIYIVGTRLGLPHRGGVVAIATALQESTLRNLTVAVDHDSLGLFQQRPSQGWGTPAQLVDPVYASTAFYQRLIQVPAWEHLTITQAAQAVQRSAFPDAYAKWEPLAAQLASDVGSKLGRAPGSDSEHCLSSPSNSGWLQPVSAPIVSGFRTADRPDHNGVDLGAARGTPIRAAAAGTVSVATCEVVPASWGCNRDGGMSIGGCGWYIDLVSAGEVVTRYCHMLTRPAVGEGQRVAAGQVLGVVGSSGNASGPHLHYEVHLRGGRGSDSAVDPIVFMRQHGAPLN